MRAKIGGTAIAVALLRGGFLFCQIFSEVLKDMKEKLEELRAQALGAIKNCVDSASLDALRVAYLGKKGSLTAILRGMGALDAEQRPVIGALANEVRTDIEEKLGRRRLLSAERREARTLWTVCA